MKLIVGLGNPGAQYEKTRHNLGFMLVDLLAREANALVKRKDCQALVGRAVVENEPVELAKPQTYMNLSGDAVGGLVAKHNLKAGLPDSLIVISDDLALPFGTLRLRSRGSAGGHNGLKSIIAALKTDAFIRLRLGIQPAHPLADTKRFVLEEFPRSQQKELDEFLARSADALRAVLRDGLDKAMSQFN